LEINAFGYGSAWVYVCFRPFLSVSDGFVKIAANRRQLSEYQPPTLKRQPPQRTTLNTEHTNNANRPRRVVRPDGTETSQLPGLEALFPLRLGARRRSFSKCVGM